MAQGTAPARSTRPRSVGPSLLASALAFLMVCAAADPLLSPLQLARRISPDPACTRVIIPELCWCGQVPCGYRVLMYVPVAFVETVRAPGDSLLPAPLLGLATADSLGTLSSSHSNLDHTAEVHAWLLGDAAWEMSGRPPCLLCRPSDARSPPLPAQAPVDPTCDPASTVAAALANRLQPDLTTLLPALAYASEFDVLNWRTGCRDRLAIGLAPAVLGRWGPLYPRQMRDLGTSPVVYSAKTAFRALSIAREQIATLPFPADLVGRMQQAYPAVSTCFDIGQQPLPEASSSALPVHTSGDGRYGWFYCPSSPAWILGFRAS